MTKEGSKAGILLVEDSASLAVLYKNYLVADSYQVDIAGTGKDALAFLDQQVPDVILLDLRLPDMSGMDILEQVHNNNMDCAVIIVTAHGSVDAASQAMRYGAVDFLTKPFDATRLRVTVGNVLDKRRLSNMVSRYQETYERDRFHRFLGASMPMQAVYRIIESAAPSRATVFITGESGTGKELCAEAIHQESPRRTQAFVALNCAAIPRDLMESEMFGHVKGAFTGAVGRRDGAASRADQGTLFLDEICEMDLDLQSKLLRFIQTGCFRRVGDTKEEQVDIRIICATNRDPLTEVRAGRFREDLYYRLNVIPLQLPPLRERGEDVLMIAADMLRRMAAEEGKQLQTFAPEVTKVLVGYPWPGNVRELENVTRNIVVLNDGDRVEFEMLPALLKQTKPMIGGAPDLVTDDEPGQTDGIAPGANSGVPGGIRPLWMEEKAIIERAIAICNGNIPKAAALLEISASTIYRKRVAWEKAAADPGFSGP